MQPRLILMCGLPGSGKTTTAQALAADRPAIRLCTDEWQHALGVGQEDERFHDLLEDRLWLLARELLRRGLTVVFEKGLWLREERDDKRREAADLGVDIELHVFDVPVEELERRLDARNAEGRPGTYRLGAEQLRTYATTVFEAPDADELALFARVVPHGSAG